MSDEDKSKDLLSQISFNRIRRVVIGEPRDLADKAVFHSVSLVPFLAWVGLGADPLSSSCYGPEEVFKTLGEHTYLAVFLALSIIATVSIIATAYSRIIEEFPHGGGGYNVATKLLGPKMGVISGCALLVDYMLTITVSIAAAGDALFSLLPDHLLHYKLVLEVFLIVFLIVINLRGVRESVMMLMPIFVLFLITHLVLIVGMLMRHAPELPHLAREVSDGLHGGVSTLGLGGVFLLFLRAFAYGGGTYTGLEAVSNGLPIIREPRVLFAKRTMFYMAASLAFTAGGLLLAYLLMGLKYDPSDHRTFNAIVAFHMFSQWPFGMTIISATLFSAAILLVVAAQAGFLSGPRVMANMATDSWLPRHFATLSDRLITQNGILLMGVASLVALLYTHGDVRLLVLMYSINVFLTFSLSMFGMSRLWWQRRATHVNWKRSFAMFAIGFTLCATILCLVTVEKFTHGGWITVFVTGSFILLCFGIHRHYASLGQQIRQFDKVIELVPQDEAKSLSPLDPAQPTAAILVAQYGGTGVHLLMALLRMFPNLYKNIVFLSVAVVDSGQFKGPDELERLKQSTEQSLGKYVELANRLGYPAASRMIVSTDVVDAGEELC